MSRRRVEPHPGEQPLFVIDDAVVSAPVPVDADARRLITLGGLADTLFISAGAGSGKTTTIVDRIVNLVVVEGVELQNIAAITFTEAAAAELRDRVRAAFERRAAESTGEALRRCVAALEQTDIAAVSTLHSYAQRVLSEHPIEAGVPPRFDVLDEVQSILALEARWRVWLDAQLADITNHPLIEWSMVLGINIARRRAASLKDVARNFNENWDRLEASTVGDPGPLAPIDLRELRRAAHEVLELAATCRNSSDNLAKFIADRQIKLEKLRDCDDPLEAVVTINSERWSNNQGQIKNWPDVTLVRSALKDFAAVAGRVVASARAAVLDQWRWRLAEFTLAAADARRREGTLEFHDLLVLARRLVRRSPPARRALHDRYTHIVIDEFQDTDPIQVELVTLIATDLDEVGTHSWRHLDVPSGRLCFVGDPKQSIYRFRRAEVALFRDACATFTPDGDPVSLVQNFRTVPTVLQWINHVFGALMQGGPPDQQPPYEALVAARREQAGDEHRVVLLGGPHDEGHRAEELRALEAADVVRAIRSMIVDGDRWLVDDHGQWRAPRFDDIVILVPSRLSLPAVEHALRDADVPYRAEASTLVFDTQEVREPLIALQAIDDPSDEIAIVASLRSTLFGCGDDELLEFVTAGGRWDYRAAAPATLPPDHAVVESLTYLRRCHDDRLWLEPSELLERVLRDRRAFELALLHRRPRDIWRRLRFIVEQARQFVEANRGGLRAFLSWAELQRYEGARVHEPLLPELDDNSVRVMTIHSAKGLEFPITIVSGLTAQRGGRRGGVAVHWGDTMPEIKMSGGSTATFDVLDDFEREMDDFEKLRLLYVACTRARDHLVISAHHVVPASASAKPRETFAKMVWEQSRAELDRSCRVLPVGDDAPFSFPPSPLESRSGDTAAARDEWKHRRDELLAPQPFTVSATAIATAIAGAAGADGISAVEIAAVEVVTEDEVVAEETSIATAAYRRGRAGSAVGRAVHAVLQLAELETGADIAALARTFAAVEGVPEWGDTIAHSAEGARRSSAVQRALAAAQLWRELFVAAPIAGRAVEGFVDLLFREGDDLVVVDYKTDDVVDDAGIEGAVVRYRPQAAVYALALEHTTGRRVRECIFVFTRRGAVVERSVAGAELDAACERVREWLAGDG
ncbi:MAG TPA: UvrD-helicase domain-containing protein [Acidimicrobiales bacterium]|nr:UvrD-helicase domain-containing protein [Acidimicrobiales bacterium]